MTDEQRTEQALEMARCADINMGALAKWQPSVTQNPMFVLVRSQLRAAIDLLEGGDGELEFEAAKGPCRRCLITPLPTCMGATLSCTTGKNCSQPISSATTPPPQCKQHSRSSVSRFRTSRSTRLPTT